MNNLHTAHSLCCFGREMKTAEPAWFASHCVFNAGVFFLLNRYCCPVNTLIIVIGWLFLSLLILWLWSATSTRLNAREIQFTNTHPMLISHTNRNSAQLFSFQPRLITVILCFVIINIPLRHTHTYLIRPGELSANQPKQLLFTQSVIEMVISFIIMYATFSICRRKQFGQIPGSGQWRPCTNGLY